MFVRVGQHSVTGEQMWELWEEKPSWSPGVEWVWDDYEMNESSRTALMLYSNPVDRYWEFFHMPDDELALSVRLERVAGRSDDEFVRVLYVRDI